VVERAVKAALLVLVGCAAEPASSVTLPSDGYFTGFASPFTSPEDCVAHNPDPVIQRCTYEIALCRDGNAGIRIGDLIYEGSSGMDGSNAIASAGTLDFELDVDTGFGSGMAGGLRWEPDTAKRWQTLQWDVIGCTTPSL
jgi:hypothetical protein